ncbi:MAG: sigma 54-interacting transcriptional regulator, partial [Proteobacteria bacterium]|nr:sigma 54-interacting transcriptional regulator [Pseudomonadota bacterium]
QERTFEPVGGNSPRRVDVRLLAATNQDLEGLIEKGKFLGDLVYRIEVIGLDLPPLRKRGEDIPLLVDYFVDRMSQRYSKPVLGVSRRAMQALMEHPWPGNVRQLENVVARAVILSKGQRLDLEDFSDLIGEGEPAGPSNGGLISGLPEEGATIKDMERELIEKTLAQCGGNKSQAAKRLGISRKGLYEKLERYGVADSQD